MLFIGIGVMFGGLVTAMYNTCIKYVWLKGVATHPELAGMLIMIVSAFFTLCGIYKIVTSK